MHPRSCAEIESEMQRPKSAAPTAANPWLRSDATDNPAITPDSPARSTLTTGLELWQSPEVERATISRVFLPADRSDPTDLSSNACAGTGEAWPVHTCVEPQPAPSDSWNYNVNGVAYADKDEAFVALQKQCEELQQAVKLLWCAPSHNPHAYGTHQAHSIHPRRRTHLLASGYAGILCSLISAH
jgi:hypothetical protein